MAYTVKNFRTKKELKEAVKAGENVYVQPQLFGGIPVTGPVWLEGPHAPEPHRWYAEAQVDEDGKVVRVK